MKVSLNIVEWEHLLHKLNKVFNLKLPNGLTDIRRRPEDTMDKKNYDFNKDRHYSNCK